MNLPTLSGQVLPDAPPWLQSPAPPNRKFQLSALADFHTGHRIRRRQISKHGTISIIRKRDIVSGRLNHDLEQATLPNLPASRLLRAGDVILHSHLECFTPLVFDAPSVCMTVAEPLVIIRIRNQAELLPEYLAWHIQTSEGQQALASYAGQGEAMEVAIEGLHCVVLAVPPPKTQRLISGIHQLYREEQLQAATAGQRPNYREAMTLEAILLKLARLG